MGVKGLTTFIESQPGLLKSYRLFNCTVVVDGNNLIHFLYSFYKINCACGGDYNTFASKTELFFSLFKECNINPIVVFDGGHDKTDRTFPTQMERWKERINRVAHASGTGRTTQPFLPTNAIESFKITLSKLGIPFVQCEYDSDAQTAAIANNFNCPVLSDDGDFFIFDVKNGYVRLSSFNNFRVRISVEQGTKYLNCKIYHLDSFLSYYPSFDKHSLPLLASIAGNDYIKFKDLVSASRHIYPIPGQKMAQIMNWLSTRQYDEAVEQLLQYKCIEKRPKFKILLEHSMSSYRIQDSNFSYLFEKEGSLCEKKTIFYSKLVTPCGMPFPKEYILSHVRGNMPNYFLNVMNFHRIFHSPQVGDLRNRSSSYCSRFVRRVLYGILFQHDTSNIDCHELLCLQDVEEYDTYKGMEVCFKVKPLFVLPSGKLVPKIHEINSMDKTSRLEILAEVIGVKKSYLKTIPTKLQLLFGTIHYWLLHCSPKPTKEFLIALLLCVVHFNVFKTSNLKRNNFKEITNDDLSRIYSLLDKISPTECASAILKLEAHFFNQRRFDVSVILSYNQIQSCLKYLISLNQLLSSPLPSPNVSDIFDGTKLHNLTKKLQTVPDNKSFVKSLLGKETPAYKIFNIFLKKVLHNIPSNFDWEYIPKKEYKLKVSNSVLKSDSQSVVNVSNKFECLNI